MRRLAALSLSLPLLFALAACSPEAQKGLTSRLQTAAPTIQAAAGTQVASAIQTAGPTLEAAARSAGTTVAGAMQTAAPTLEAAGTQVAGAIGTAGPTLEAAGKAAAFMAVTMQTWAWQGTESASGGQAPKDASKYTVKFNSDGSLAVQADCNSGAGTYTLDGDGLTISLGAMTMAACPPGSLDTTFTQQLSQVGGFKFRPGTLELLLNENGGTMTFQGVP